VAARSSTLALTNALLPYLAEIAEKGFDGAVCDNADVRRGTYLYRGHCWKESLARMFDVPHEPPPCRER
jgi:alanine dehydrogenase